MRYFLVQLIFVSYLPAAVIRVPGEYGTIQSALNVIQSGDTILVDAGIYPEALFAPPFDFVLRGNVGTDTSAAARPEVDPALVGGSDTLCCLTTRGGNLFIEDFAFRNGPGMFPHAANFRGGILHRQGNITLNRCTFDSTYCGLGSPDDTVTLNRCRFTDNIGWCVYANGPLIARDCSFHSDSTVWAQVTTGPNSLIERCIFSGVRTPAEVLLLRNSGNIVRECRFWECGPNSAPVLRTRNDSLIENNTFENCITGNAVMTIMGDSPRQAIIRGNRFSGILPTLPDAGGACLSVSSCDRTQGNCEATTITGNYFNDCLATHWKAIGYSGSVQISDNYLVRMLPETQPCISAHVGSTDGILRENVFLSNHFAVQAEGSGSYVDARWNWWGDSTGPYHPVLNPDGQGDAVSDSVEFEPWYTDTTFAYSEREHNAPIVTSATLEVYPNPFNSEARVRLELNAANVRVEMFDLTGRKVQTLFSGDVKGEAEFSISGTELPSGIYFLRVWDTRGNFSRAVSKLALLK